jgi:hypothetical protein
MQVESSDEIEVGQWVRLYARAPSPARRRSLLQSSSGGGRAANQPGYLPLNTTALRHQLEVAAERAAAELGGEGVTAAAQPGTLDAYLYGDNLVDSGTSEQAPALKRQLPLPCWLLPCSVQPAWLCPPAGQQPAKRASAAC